MMSRLTGLTLATTLVGLTRALVWIKAGEGAEAICAGTNAVAWTDWTPVGVG